MTQPPDHSRRERLELEGFRDIWSRGYSEGDPLDPMGPSGYRVLGYMSVLHAVYLACIRPYVGPTTRVLEIGPGRGSWTRCFVRHQAREIWALDAKSAEENKFFQHVGEQPGLHYVQVNDSSLSQVPDQGVDYFFSFGCFCHVYPPMVEEYLGNLAAKMTSGARGFAMIADYAKYNRAVADTPNLSLLRVLESRAFKSRPHRFLRRLVRWYCRLFPLPTFEPRDPEEGDAPRPGRWYDLGLEPACQILERHGFEVLQPDMDLLARDPIIHFQKP